MAFQLPNLPNYNVQQPQIPSAMEQYGKMLQLKSLLGQQQMQPLQQQEAQQDIQSKSLQNQQQQLQLQSQQAMIKAWSDPDFLKGFTGTDKAESSGLGFDPDAMTKSLITKGVLPKDALALTGQFVDRSQKMAATAKDIAQTGEANAATAQKGYGVLADRIGGILDAPTAKAPAMLDQLKQDLMQNPKLFPGVPPVDLGHVYRADIEHLPAIASVIGLDAKIADFHKAKAEATTAEQKVIPPGGGLSQDAQQQVGVRQAEIPAEVAKEVAVATNPAVQQGKVNVATAEGRARQLVEGMEKPVYAFVPQKDGTVAKQLMSATDALQAGIKTMMPVGAKEVSDDTMLINRLGDVHQKIAQYEQNLQNLGTTISSKDQGNIAALLGKQSFKLGAFGSELPVDRLNAALDKENIKGLSPDAKKLLVSYYNARESMQGYSRVLSGSGRSNEMAMQLNLDALPNPGTTDKPTAQESLTQFKQNLGVVGQGLPKIPGVKSPEEFAKPAAAQNLQVGQSVMIKGQPMKITKVHPDGSFDAK